MSLYRNNKPYRQAATSRKSHTTLIGRKNLLLLAERAKARNAVLAAKIEALQASLQEATASKGDNI